MAASSMRDFHDDDIFTLLKKGQAEPGSAARHFQEASALIFQAYGEAIFRYCRRILPTLDDTKDVAQEVYLSVYRSFLSGHLPDDKRGPAALRVWLFSIARRRVQDFYRNYYRDVGGLEEIRSQPPEEHDRLSAWRRESPQAEAVEATHIASWTAALIARALPCLSAREQLVIKLRWYGEFSPQEQADALNTSPDNIRKMHSRAIRKLRAEITRRQSEEHNNAC